MQGLLDIDTTLKKSNLRLKAALLEAIFVKKLALKDGSGFWTQGRLEGCQDTKVYFSKLTKVYLIFDTMIFKA